MNWNLIIFHLTPDVPLHTGWESLSWTNTLKMGKKWQRCLNCPRKILFLPEPPYLTPTFFFSFVLKEKSLSFWFIKQTAFILITEKCIFFPMEIYLLFKKKKVWWITSCLRHCSCCCLVVFYFLGTFLQCFNISTWRHSHTLTPTHPQVTHLWVSESLRLFCSSCFFLFSVVISLLFAPLGSFTSSNDLMVPPSCKVQVLLSQRNSVCHLLSWQVIDLRVTGCSYVVYPQRRFT